MTRLRPYLWTALRIVIGGIFIYASVYKLASPGTFAHEVHNYKLLPVALVNPTAIILPPLQLLCGIALVANVWVLPASFLIAAMMGTFCLAVASALVRGLNISCGCFKAGGSAATWWTLGRDITLFSLTVLNLYRAWAMERKNGTR